MEEFGAEWEKFYAEWNLGYAFIKERCGSIINSLMDSISKLDQLKSSEETKGFVKNYFSAVCDFLKPIIGLQYVSKDFFTDNYACPVLVDGQDRIKRVALEFGDKEFVYLVCESVKGVFYSYVKEGQNSERKKKNKGVDEYVDGKLMDMGFDGIEKRLSRLGSRLGELVGSLPEPLIKLIDDEVRSTGSLEKSLREEIGKKEENAKKLFMLSATFSDLHEMVRKKTGEMREAVAERVAAGKLPGQGIMFSVDEILEFGIVPDVEPKRLEGPVLALFRGRDQRVLGVMEELRGKNAESFLSLLRVLEAEVAREFLGSKFMSLSEIWRDLSYFKNCGVPIDEYKNSVLASVRKKEGGRRREVNKFLQDLEDL